MYAWTLLTEVNCLPGTGWKNTIVFYYIHAEVFNMYYTCTWLQSFVHLSWVIYVGNIMKLC